MSSVNTGSFDSLETVLLPVVVEVEAEEGLEDEEGTTVLRRLRLRAVTKMFSHIPGGAKVMRHILCKIFSSPN